MKKINLLKNYSIRNTRPRRKVIESMRSLGKRHFSADDILYHIKQKKSVISRASVYRTIKLFLKVGLLRTIDLGENFHIYELSQDSSHHDHIYCLRCGKIIEFEEHSIERLQNIVCRKKHFRPISHTLRIVGLCKNCNTRKMK